MRKKKLGIFVSLVMLTTVFAAAIPGSVGGDYTSPEGLVSYLELNEGSGPTASDSINNNDGVLEPSGSAIWTSGKMGTALQFEGLSTYVDCGNDASLSFENEDSFTIEAWVKTEDTDGQIVAKMEGSPHTGYQFMLYQDKLSIFLISTWTSNSIFVQQTTSNLISDNTWHHVAVTYDGSSSALGITLYLDGGVVATDTKQDSLSSSMQNSLNTRLGMRGDDNWGLAGTIDEIAIHNTVLTQSDITGHWNNGNGIELTPIASTVALWHFNEGSGTTVADSSLDNYNDGTIIQLPSLNGPTWITGQVDDALSFDGSDDYVDCGNDASISFERTDVFTMEAWVKTADPDGQIVAKMDGSPHTGYQFMIYQDKLSIFLINNYPSNSIFVQQTTASAISDNTWHHVAMTYDGSSSASGITLYLDGAIVATDVIHNSLSGSMQNSLNLRIGLRGDNNWGLAGLIDEVAIWGRELTLDEINNHYINGLVNDGYVYITPEDAILDLFVELQDLNLPRGTENSLLSKLDAALACLDNGNDNAAINILNAFKNSVEAQRGKKLEDVQATELIEAADIILATI